MKQSPIHSYHGVTHRPGNGGWVIQIKLYGRYRAIRTYASDAETAARRHDRAIWKLRAFTEPNAEPNFPAEFPPEPIDRGACAPDEKEFADTLGHFFHMLTDEVEKDGTSVDALEEARDRMREDLRLKHTIARQAARAKMTSLLHKARPCIRALGLTARENEQLSRHLNEALKIVMPDEPKS